VPGRRRTTGTGPLTPRPRPPPRQHQSPAQRHPVARNQTTQHPQRGGIKGPSPTTPAAGRNELSRSCAECHAEACSRQEEPYAVLSPRARRSALLVGRVDAGHGARRRVHAALGVPGSVRYSRARPAGPGPASEVPGPGKRARSTVRQKMNLLDHYFAFLEQRYAGEIARRFGVGVESPVDPFNRPRHRGDFGLRVPPSQRATREFFARWRDSLDQARKPVIARRDYVMGKLTYLSGVRAAELCSVRIGDVHWESGQWGRFLVNGKGARGSGPRQREAYLFADGRALLWWYVEQVRGEFCDDPEDPTAPLFPSERIPTAVTTLGLDAPSLAVTPSTFRRTRRARHPHRPRHRQRRRAARAESSTQRWRRVVPHTAAHRGPGPSGPDRRHASDQGAAAPRPLLQPQHPAPSGRPRGRVPGAADRGRAGLRLHPPGPAGTDLCVSVDLDEAVPELHALPEGAAAVEVHVQADPVFLARHGIHPGSRPTRRNRASLRASHRTVRTATHANIRLTPIRGHRHQYQGAVLENAIDRPRTALPATRPGRYRIDLSRP
jgi:integrase